MQEHYQGVTLSRGRPAWFYNLNEKGKKGLILLAQIRAVDKTRLIKKLGDLDADTQVKLCDSLQEIFVF